MKKRLWVLAVLLILLISFLVQRLFFNDPKPDINGSKPQETEEAAEKDETLQESEAAIDPMPSDNQAVQPTSEPLTDEEYDQMIQQEVEELQQEEPLIDEHGEEVPTIDVSTGEEIIIGESESGGSL